MAVTYLMNYRLQWGKRDNLSLLTSALDVCEDKAEEVSVPDPTIDRRIRKILPPLPDNAPRYFTVDTPSEFISIIQNDWPYSGEQHELIVLQVNRLPSDGSNKYQQM
jgi:hypothetical protein